MQKSNDPQGFSAERRVSAVVAIVLIAYLISAFAAAIYARGLYQDGAYYILKMAEGEWFYLKDPARMAVQALRQAPVVGLTRYTDLSLYQRAQAFTFVMLVLPPALVAVCWFIAPRGMKAWTLLPVLHLLIGLSTTSFEAVGEGAIAAAYIWVLIFLLVFRTRSVHSQFLFLLLALPTTRLHESVVLCAPILILICALRAAGSRNLREWIFLAASTAIFAWAAIYEFGWIVSPRIPSDAQNALRAVFGFEFLVFEGRWNLPVIAGALAVGTIALLFVARPRRHSAIAFAFAMICAALIVAAIIVDETMAPRAQAQARYNPIFATVLLGFIFACALKRGLPRPIAVPAPMLVVVLALTAAQFGADAVATRYWSLYIRDFEARLSNFTGLVSWNIASYTGNPTRDHIWNVITIDWTLPIMGIILAPRGDVKALIDYPPGTLFQPLDPRNLNTLPSLRGVSYEDYRRAMSR